VTLARPLRAVGCAAVLGVLGATGADAPLVPGAALRTSFGGVVVESTFTSRSRGEDALLSAWAPGARGKLMHCKPRCRVVPSIPLPDVLNVGTKTPYRVVLGGRFREGQRVTVVLTFRSGAVRIPAVVMR